VSSKPQVNAELRRVASLRGARNLARCVAACTLLSGGCAPAIPVVPRIVINPNGFEQRLAFMVSGSLDTAPPPTGNSIEGAATHSARSFKHR
jgi:hypothetical protein